MICPVTFLDIFERNFHILQLLAITMLYLYFVDGVMMNYVYLVLILVLAQFHEKFISIFMLKSCKCLLKWPIIAKRVFCIYFFDNFQFNYHTRVYIFNIHIEVFVIVTLMSKITYKQPSIKSRYIKKQTVGLFVERASCLPVNHT